MLETSLLAVSLFDCSQKRRRAEESVSNSIRGKMSDSSSDSGNEMGENAEMEKVSETMKIIPLPS